MWHSVPLPVLSRVRSAPRAAQWVSGEEDARWAAGSSAPRGACPWPCSDWNRVQKGFPHSEAWSSCRGNVTGDDMS